MRSRLIRTLTLAGVALAAFALVSPPVYGAGTRGFTLDVLVGGAPRTEYRHDGSVYIEAVRGRNYVLRLTNPTPYRIAVALSVDGLNTIDAKHADAWSASKWVIDPYDSIEISGWQVSQKSARKFFFTGERHSYGAMLGETDNLGVIEAVCYRERPRPVPVIGPIFERERLQSRGDASSQPSVKGEASGAPRSASVAPEEAKKSLSDEYAATGMGSRTRHEVERVHLDLDPSPIASVRIRYEFHPQLVRLGILPGQESPLERREHARGFEAWCPEPN